VARVLLAAAVLWIIVFTLKCKLPQRRNLIRGCLAGIFPYTLLAFGQCSVDSALAMILNSTILLFVSLVGLTWTGQETLTFGPLFGRAARTL